MTAIFENSTDSRQAPTDERLLPHQIGFEAPAEVLAAIERIGRTEDVHLCPDNRRLAIAGYVEDKILVLDLENEVASDDVRRLKFSSALELTSASLDNPHGVFWLNSETIIVANRGGDVVFFPVPASSEGACTQVLLEPLGTISAEVGGLASPGSVAATELGGGLYEILVCNNSGHNVTQHIVDIGQGFRVIAGRPLLTKGFKVPDGVAFCPETHWLAISNHHENAVYLYRHDGFLAADAEPDGVLLNAGYPHGLRFVSGGRYLFVADAGGRDVKVYDREDADWSGEHHPIDAFQTVPEGAFLLANENPEEGGSKGIEILGDTGILVATCEALPLALFDVSHLFADAQNAHKTRGNEDAADRTIPVFTQIMQHLHEDNLRLQNVMYRAIAGNAVTKADLERGAYGGDSRAEALLDSEEKLRDILNSKSWKVTAPLRFASFLVQKYLR